MNANQPTCPSCGARLTPEDTKCHYCGSQVSAEDDRNRSAPLGRSVREAADEWATRIRGAPKNFSSLITSVEIRDQILERVATEIVRRELREERLGAGARAKTPAPVRVSDINPFEISPAELRQKSEHVTSCNYCGGGGMCRCNGCTGSGRQACRECNGSGRVIKYNKRSHRTVNCGVCHASGSVACAGCGGTGSVSCGACAGGGSQLSWLTYDQTSYWSVAIEPSTPITRAHRYLEEPRMLLDSELEGFSIIEKQVADGQVSIEGFRGQNGAIVQRVATALNQQTERINRQQYIRFAAVRRDARFEMAGVEGTLVLSGRDLIGSTTPEALYPIRRRQTLRLAGVAISALVGIATLVAFHGSSPYFVRSNSHLVWLLLLLIAGSIPATGAYARALKQKSRLGEIKPVEKGFAGLLVLSFLAMLGVGFFSRPSVAEVNADLARGDVGAARTTVDALKETRGFLGPVKDADDAVSLAEAKKSTGDARLATLDAIAADHGPSSAAAAADARAERLSQIQKAIDAKDSKASLSLLDKWFANQGRDDADVRELRAKSYEVAEASCNDDACRFANAHNAAVAAPTDARTQASTEAHDKLFGELANPDIAATDSLTRLKKLRAVRDLGLAAQGAASDDVDLANKATAAVELGKSGRAKVPLVGADRNVAFELLEATESTGPTNVPEAVVEGEAIFLPLDSQSKCKGVYAVGASEGSRKLTGTKWSPDRLLSQAVGHDAKVKSPSAGGSTSQWYEGATPVVARFDNGVLVELRMGDASP